MPGPEKDKPRDDRRYYQWVKKEESEVEGERRIWEALGLTWEARDDTPKEDEKKKES